jgi:hypothetical protein
MGFLNSSTILNVILASVLGFVVAPRLQLVSRKGALAMKLAAGSLVLGIALNFAMPFVMNFFYRLSLGVEPWEFFPAVLQGAFWALLAWSVLEVIRSGQPVKELR